MVNKTFKCPKCKQELLAVSNSYRVEHICVNKNCSKYTSAAKIRKLKISNIKMNFFDTWFYKYFVYYLIKALNWKTYRNLYRKTNIKIKYGVWPNEAYFTGISTCKYISKLMMVKQYEERYSWPVDYKNLDLWEKDIKKCNEVLQDMALFHKNHKKWLKKHNLVEQHHLMHVFPASDDSSNFEAKFFTSKEEDAQMLKCIKAEEKLNKEYKEWMKWLVDHIYDL